MPPHSNQEAALFENPQEDQRNRENGGRAADGKDPIYKTLGKKNVADRTAFGAESLRKNGQRTRRTEFHENDARDKDEPDGHLRPDYDGVGETAAERGEHGGSSDGFGPHLHRRPTGTTMNRAATNLFIVSVARPFT